MPPLRVFYSYAHEDEELRLKLRASLSGLRDEGRIEDWSDREIIAGQAWEGEIHEALDGSEIILLLLSNDFLASSYIRDVEVERALALHEQQKAVVVPILLRPVVLEHTRFKDLQALPTDARAVTSWPNVDEALVDVVRGLVRIIEARAEPKPPLPPPGVAVQAVREFDDLSVRISMDEVEFRVDDTEFRGRPDFSADTLARLADLRRGDPNAYGGTLFHAVFGARPLAEGYERARDRIRQRARLRLRLHIDPAAKQLQGIRWEALVDDQRPPPRRLATQHGTPLSRFVRGADLEPVRGTRVKLLVVVSDPAGLREAGVEDYDAAAELALVEDVLRRLDDRVDYEVHDGRAIPFLVRDRLLQQRVDVLHLVAPGLGGNGEPSRLLLEDEAGERPDAVTGEVLGPMVDGLAALRLVVLSTGYTSTASDPDAHLDIAAQLLEFGVPAVLAMQGETKETAHLFTKAFYDTLLHSPSSKGLVDAAANHAREAVWFRWRDAWDWAAPVVFLGGEGHIYDAEPAEAADVALQGVGPAATAGVPAVAPAKPAPDPPPPSSAAQRRLEAYHLLTVKHGFTAADVADLAWSFGYENPGADLETLARGLIMACERAERLEALIQQIAFFAAQPRRREADDDAALRALGSLAV